MTNFLKEIIAIINFDLVIAIGLMVLVYCAAKKRDLQQKRKRVDIHEKEPEVLWIVK